MYRVLVIGNANSIWLKEYVKKIHIAKGAEVYLTAYNPINERFLKEYNKLGVNIVPLYSQNKLVDKISKAFNIFCFIRKNGKFLNCVDIQSPPHNNQAIFLSHILKGVKAKKSITFWGSDLMRINVSEARILSKILVLADKINISTEEMVSVFKSHYGNTFDSKLVSAKFGSLAFDAIDKIRDSLTKQECKAQFGLNSEKITVAVGHNGNKEQQHIKVLKELAYLDFDIKNKIELVFHVGYGLKDNYADEIAEEAKKTGISYVIIKDMLDLDDIAKLRNATDIIIHAQTTDALSGSIRECIYAGTVLINPTWINYEEFDNIGIQYFKYSEFSEINSMVSKLISGDICVDIHNNIKLMKIFSWESVSRDWESIFQRGL